MGVFEILKEALRIARTHKSLWLFGFLVGLGGGFNFDGGGGGGQLRLPVPPAVAVTPPDPGRVALVIVVATAVIAVFVVLKFLATGALIEGVKRARRNGSMTVREGFREGWANWGVLFRVALLYLPLYVGSVVALAGSSALVFRAFGTPSGVVAAGVALLIGVPWLVTLYMWQAFAERIAVLENRRALDAMRKARLFLHGRLHLGLKLFVAGFIGVLFVGLLTALVTIPVVLSAQMWGFPAVVIAVVTLPPLAFIAVAFVGVVTSSVWTLGYLQQVEQ